MIGGNFLAETPVLKRTFRDLVKAVGSMLFTRRLFKRGFIQVYSSGDKTWLNSIHKWPKKAYSMQNISFANHNLDVSQGVQSVLVIDIGYLLAKSLLCNPGNGQHLEDSTLDQMISTVVSALHDESHLGVMSDDITIKADSRQKEFDLVKENLAFNLEAKTVWSNMHESINAADGYNVMASQAPPARVKEYPTGGVRTREMLLMMVVKILGNVVKIC